MSTSATNSARKRKLCPHCNEYVAVSTYYNHRDLYFREGEWQTIEDEVARQSSSDGDDWDCDDQYVDRFGAPSYSQSETMPDLDAPDDAEPSVENYEQTDFSLKAPQLSDSDDDMSENSTEEGLEIICDSDSDEDDSDETERAASTSYRYKLLRGIMVFLMMWQFKFGISEAGVAALILFLHHLFRLFAAFTGHQELAQLTALFPVTIRGIRKFLKMNKLPITKFVVCPKCHSLYDYDWCTKKRANGEAEVKCCEFVRYPNHPQISRQAPCGEALTKIVRTESGKVRLKPKKLYCYSPLQDSFQNLLNKADFVEKCEMWRKRTTDETVLADVFDSNIWKEYQTVDGQPFLSLPYNYVVALNVDWFKPFLHSKYSLGAIYLVVLNLPREERYLVENVILVGLIPGPREPPLLINSYLYPLVKELKAFQHGIRMQLPSLSAIGKVTIKIMLGPIICDIPASRKTCGFMSHSASLGCSKCYKRFKSGAFGESLDYSGYDVQNWSPRNITYHRFHAYMHCVSCLESKAAEERVEQEYGCRYSVLLDLPYYDLVRYHLIDPMHNLLLGTAKYMFGVWVEKKILSTENVKEIEDRIQQFCVPYNIGRLPVKIDDGMANMKADQMRNWIVVYSVVCLKGLLPDPDMQCWRLFVRACCLLLTRQLKRSDLEVAHSFLQHFCSKYQELYGAQRCTPNMHLHLHLKQCLLDCGPVYAIWAFSFERYNGLLEGFHTNQKAIELQVMKKFINKQFIENLGIDKDVQELLLPLQSHQSIDYAYALSNNLTKICKMCSPGYIPQEMAFSGVDLIQVSNPKYEKVFDDTGMEQISKVYATLYPMYQLCHASRFYQWSKQVIATGDTIASVRSRGERSPMVFAYWYCSEHNCCLCCNVVRAGIVEYFFIHKAEFKLRSASTGSRTLSAMHVFAKVHWLKLHPLKDMYGMPVSLWSSQIETSSAAEYIPVLRIASTGAYVKTIVHLPPHAVQEQVYVSVPVMKNSYFVV